MDTIIRPFYEIFSNLPAVLTDSQALEAAVEYRRVLLRVLAKMERDSETTWKDLSMLEVNWSLATLCFLQAPHIEPVDFVEQYLRWVQFHFAGRPAPS